MGGTASHPHVQSMICGGQMHIIRHSKQINAFVNQHQGIFDEITSDKTVRFRLEKERGGKPRRASEEEYNTEISKKMVAQFCYSGNTAVFGFDKDGQFIATVVGTFSKKARSQLISSASYCPSKDWKAFYIEVFNLLRRHGKRKLQSDSPWETAHATERETILQLGFKRQKTQDNGVTRSGYLRLVHPLSRWDCCPYSKQILKVAKLVKLQRANIIHSQSSLDSLMEKLTQMNNELLRVVLEYL